MKHDQVLHKYNGNPSLSDLADKFVVCLKLSAWLFYIMRGVQNLSYNWNAINHFSRCCFALEPQNVGHLHLHNNKKVKYLFTPSCEDV